MFAFEDCEVDRLSYIEVDITPVVAMLIGLGLRLIAVPGLNLTEAVPWLPATPPAVAGVSVPPLDMALGDRPAIYVWGRAGLILLMIEATKAACLLGDTGCLISHRFFFSSNF